MTAFITILEKILLEMNLKIKIGSHSGCPVADRCVNLQHFQTSDGPVYRGLFQEVEPFLTWIHVFQIFFESKGITNSAEEVKKFW
ncbi:hypothetical protein VP01_893g5 [Puccinia sorghi]|uniref:Uncharacterized protein n=1 Tax=Puccinia sorghi TaxID=27349 RepID=A0A0L6UA61_9BASI|nr:hypothetical protein VP01_893g5 [Puccinia sorghi]